MPKGSAAQQAADCNTIRHIQMIFTWWINKATDTHSYSVIIIYFQHQQRSRERACMMSYDDDDNNNNNNNNNNSFNLCQNEKCFRQNL